MHMMTIYGLSMVDLRSVLPHAGWIIGQRPKTTSLTWHWNGPKVAEERRAGQGLIDQLVADAAWQMRPGWGGTVNGAPHLMYHIVIDAAGTIYLACDLDEILWHCAHSDGNTNGLSIHYAIGEGQQPTPAQMTAGIQVTLMLASVYNIPNWRLLGHQEWKHATLCPGPDLMRQLVAFRSGAGAAVTPTIPPSGIRLFQINPALTAPARVRQAPRTHWQDGREVIVAGKMKPGTVLYVDADPIEGFKRRGEVVSGNPYWVHMARIPNEQADLGFVSETLGLWLS